MMNVDIEQIDLNGLFQFDLLKQILLNSAKTQENINEELNKINETNKIRDERITKLENIYKTPDNQLIITNQSIQIDNNNIKNNDIIIDNNIENITDNKNENEYENENKNINKVEEEKKDENKNDNDNVNKGEKKEEVDNLKSTELSEMLQKKKDENENKNKNEKMDNYPVHDSKNLSNELLLSMMKGNREQTEKINNLEKKLMNQIEFRINRIKEDYQKQIFYLSQENKTSFQKIDEHINNISNKNKDQQEKIEECLLKCNSFDILNMIKDNGDGSIDLAKVLIKSLEDKVFKKFEFIDQKIKQESLELMKTMKMSENINNKMDVMDRNFNEIRQNEIQRIKEDIENNKTNNDKKFDDINQIINDKEINLLQKLNQTEKNLLILFNENKLNVDKSIEIDDKPRNNEEEKIDPNNKNIVSENIEVLVKRINDLRIKTNNLESTLKYITKDWNIDILKKDIKDIKVDLEKKITKDNLKELYNLHLSDLEEINELREHASYINDDLKKTIKNVSSLAPKVESLMGHFLIIKQSNKNVKIQQIDTSRFIDNIKYNEGMSQVLNKIDNYVREIDSLRRDLTDVKEEQKIYEKIERVDRLEEDIEKKIDENFTKIRKNKNEINKLTKALEVEVKSIWNEFKRKEQAESWLLAKQPMKCFNCATCENNIKKQIPNDEVIHWNKYPQNDKNYRIGKGFSHMLEMMTSQLINNLENDKENEYVPINEENTQNNVSTINNNNEESNVAQLGRSSSEKRFKKGSAKDNSRTIFSLNSGRVRLPQVYDISKKKLKLESIKNINSLSVYEKNEMNIKEKIKKNDSPQIIKITKKRDINQILPDSKKHIIKSDILKLKNI